MDKMKILVVDDDPEMRETLGIFCRSVMNFDTTVAASGSEAVAALDRGEFRLILQDLQMPGMDGFTVLAHAVKRNPAIVKIVLTGLMDPVITKRVEDAGAIFVAKPFQPKVLKFVIEKALQETGKL
jgi:CheY-like chemotaxis protein